MSRLMLKTILSSLLFSVSGALFPAHAIGAGTLELEAGGRNGFHGTVVYGSGPYFIDHIPMLMAPHDVQLVAEVELTRGHGVPLSSDFSQGSFTLEPAFAFSLDDLVAGKLSGFGASIHEGSFEQGGPILPHLGVVFVTIKKILLARELPSASSEEMFTFGPDENRFSVNVITPGRSRQEITSMRTGKRLWCMKGPDFATPCD